MELGTSSMLILCAGGVLAGVLNGWLGLGGMSVYVPALIWTLQSTTPDHDALLPAVLLNAFVVMEAVSLATWLAHHNQRTVHYRNAGPVALGALLGVTGGFAVAHSLGLIPNADLIFGGYLLAVGAFSVLQPTETQPHQVGWTKLLGIGVAGGVAGALAGFNGNSIFVPSMRRCGLAIKEAVATGQFVGMVVAGAMLLLLGLTYGFSNVHPGICALLALGGVVGSYWGAQWKKRMSVVRMHISLVMAYVLSGAVLLSRALH